MKRSRDVVYVCRYVYRIHFIKTITHFIIQYLNVKVERQYKIQCNRDIM